MQTHSFEDFDAFSNSVRDVDAVMMLQNPVRRKWSVSQVDLPEMNVQLGRLGSGNIVEGESWSNGYLLYMPLTDTCEYSANGTVLPKNSFMILEPGCDFCLSTKFEHDWCSIFVPTDKLVRGGDFAEPPSVSEKMTCRVALANRQVANQFRALMGQVINTAANCPQFESGPAASLAAGELLKVASLVVGQQRDGVEGVPTREGRPRLPRQEIIRHSKELLEKRDGETVSVGELAAAADVSERTLQTAFNEYYGIGPVHYLRLRQLRRIRHALRAADPDAVSVVDVLARHGEWQFGRFASRYRRLFGELPSQTLRAKRR